MAYPYAGDGRPYTGPSYRAMAILGVVVALIAGILLALCDYAAARPTPGQEQQLSPAELKALKDFIQTQKASQPAAVAKPALPAAIDPPPVVVAPAPPSAPVVVAPTAPAVVAPPPVAAPAPAAPPVTQNTVTTTGPVASETTISVGTLAGQVLTWAAAAFGSLAATVFTAWGVRLFKLAGVQMTDAARDRLQAIILNGLNSGAEQVSHDLVGKGQVEVKNAVVAKAVEYAQAHGADTMKQLGLDPKSGAAVEVIKARVETLLADPASPTPAVLDPAKPAAVDPAAPAKAA